MTDTDIMPFGKHKGKRMEDVPASYLLWLWDSGVWQEPHKPIHAYIKDSWSALLHDCPDHDPLHKP